LLLERLREAERAAPARPFADHLADLATAGDADDGDDEELRSDDVRAHRDALVERGRAFVADEHGAGGVAAFVSWLDASTRGLRGERAVDLVTFHRAKGLEWPLVFVTGLERGLVPINWATTPSALAEERRLLHVACSRAEDQLHCSWARARSVGARRSARDPSPWLADLEVAAVRRVRPPRALTERVDDMRDVLRAVSPPAPRRRQVR
jgi:DNA helicase-2/ATP-dependent DNA helicase PcrA